MPADDILRVALVQLDASADVAANIASGDRAGRRGGLRPARGSWPCPSTSSTAVRTRATGPRPARSPDPGPEAFAEVARRRDAWILVGSLAETSPDPSRPWNTSVLVAPDGSIAATYRKIHLFDVSVDDGPVDRESERVTPGDHAVVAEVDGVRLGLSICYDLRFPELYRALALAGAEVMTVPANFTERTGRDHWEVLLRARAIENGAYVLAPSQVGGPPGQPAFGRSMIVDPWGTVVAQAPDRVGIVSAALDLGRVRAIRRQIPALANRRPEAAARVVVADPAVSRRA